MESPSASFPPQDFKGTVVAAVRLNITHDHIAYGMTDGTLRVESITKHTVS